jgi:hypothetical protein
VNNGVKKRLLLREVNERIREVNKGFASLTGSYEVFCECMRADCLERVEVPAATYEEARHAERRFVVRAGHEEPELERILADCITYRVVDPTR